MRSFCFEIIYGILLIVQKGHSTPDGQRVALNVRPLQPKRFFLAKPAVQTEGAEYAGAWFYDYTHQNIDLIGKQSLFLFRFSVRGDFDTLSRIINTTGLHIGPIELALSGGAITYAVTFLCTDIIGEIWGKATAQRVVKYGFIGQIFATACIMVTGVFPATDAVMDNAYQTLLGQNWIFVIGSLSAYLVSQSWDVAVFHAIRDRYIAKHGGTKGGRWLWNNGSTITSQIWDTVIYAVISFGFGLGWVHTHEGRMQLIGIIIGQYLLKACLALLDTPFFYFFTRNADRR